MCLSLEEKIVAFLLLLFIFVEMKSANLYSDLPVASFPGFIKEIMAIISIWQNDKAKHQSSEITIFFQQQDFPRIYFHSIRCIWCIGVKQINNLE